jgi:hypothetical protein
MALLAVFEPLRIRDRFVLRAYRFASGGIGKGVVWAVPEDAPFPDPQECLSGPTEPIPGSLADVPRPDGALDTFMEAIAGDRTLWSYLCASLLEREAREFGSICHGLEWTEPTLLGMDPWEQADRFPDSDGAFSPTIREGWDWRRPEPADWRPAARAVDIGVEVTFFAYDPVGQEAIIGHTDRYRTGSYVFQHERDTVALGAGGFIH